MLTHRGAGAQSCVLAARALREPAAWEAAHLERFRRTRAETDGPVRLVRGLPAPQEVQAHSILLTEPPLPGRGQEGPTLSPGPCEQPASLLKDTFIFLCQSGRSGATRAWEPPGLSTQPLRSVAFSSGCGSPGCFPCRSVAVAPKLQLLWLRLSPPALTPGVARPVELRDPFGLTGRGAPERSDEENPVATGSQ